MCPTCGNERAYPYCLDAFHEGPHRPVQPGPHPVHENLKEIMRKLNRGF